MPARTAALIGSTGLIGSQLLPLLIQSPVFETVRLLVRRPVPITSPKVEMKLVNFGDQESVKLAIDGADTVFVAVGTTQKKVKGDKDAYRRIDYGIPTNAARFAAETGATHFHLVSAVGADAKSSNFYLRLKGETEQAVRQQPIPHVGFFRPSILLGDRQESRPGERVAQAAASFFGFMLVGGWEKYRAISAQTVAKAMMQAAMDDKRGVFVYEHPEMVALSNRWDGR